MKKNNTRKKQITKNLFDIESKDRLTSDTIDDLSNKSNLLDIYLELSNENTFSELLFRLTNKKFNEEKAKILWDAITKHRDYLNNNLQRDVGILVATLDYLTNITEEITNPKISHDQTIEDAASMATTDPMTGLYSRNIFNISLEKEIIKSIRYKKSLSLIIIDIDDFKIINDTYGHQEGDNVIIDLVTIVNKDIRSADLFARYGGEEFAIIMPETNIKTAVLVAERIRLNVSKILKKEKHNITISIGACTLSKKINSSYQLIKYADDALYKAKKSGKNCVKAI